jgi:hypothetical protein
MNAWVSAQRSAPQAADQRGHLNSNEPTTAHILALQRAMGNRRVRRLVATRGALVSRNGNGKPSGSSAAPTAQSERPTISPETESAMRADVERIVALLREQVMDASEEQQALDMVKRWARADDLQREQRGFEGSDHIDRFLFLLKMRVYSRRTARSAWVEQWSNAYDDLWHELEDTRLDEYKRVVARSKKHGSAGPESKRMESAWSYVGKREAMGAVGILKAMGLAVTGVVDTSIWVSWKLYGGTLREALKRAGVDIPENAPQISKYVDKSFDETAAILAETMGVDVKEKLLAGMSSYEFGATAGKVPAALMLGGAMSQAGAAGQAIGLAQTAQQAEGLYDNVRKLRAGPPPMSWSQIFSKPEIWLQIVGAAAGAIGSAGSFAQAESATFTALQKLGAVANAGQVSVMVAAYLALDDDPTLSADEKSRRKAELLADMVSTTALMINDRYGKDFEEAWRRRAGQAAPLELLTGKETAPGEAEAGVKEPPEAKTSEKTPPIEAPGAVALAEPEAPLSRPGELETQGYRPKPGERSTTKEQWQAQESARRLRSNMTQEKWRTQDRARRLREWAQRNDLPKGALPAGARMGKPGVTVPEYVHANPDNYYYNPETHTYNRIGDKRAAESERARQMRQRIAEEVSPEQKPIGFTGKPTQLGLSKAGRARQVEILKLHDSDPPAAGRAYEKLIQGEELGLTGLPQAKKIEPYGKGKGGYVAEDIEPSSAKSTVHEITMEGWKGGFSDRKRHQLLLMLKDTNVSTLQLTVPRLSPQALVYLERLQATFPGKLVLVAETYSQ